MADGALTVELFVAGDGPNSRAARANLAALCRQAFAAPPPITVVDVLVDPGRAAANGVLLTPQLVVRSGDVVRRVVGTLAVTDVVLAALDVADFAESP